jgi:hypothetical protein
MKFLHFTCMAMLCFYMAVANDIRVKTGFEKNEGQVIDQYGKPNQAVLYHAARRGMNVSLTRDGFHYTLFKTNDDVPALSSKMAMLRYIPPTINYHRLEFTFLGIDPAFEHNISQKSFEVCTYYLPDKKLPVNVAVGQKVLYKNIYPKIDIEFLWHEEKGFKYNFIVHPGGRVSDIRFKVNGSKEDKISQGTVHITSSLGTINERIPLSYQILGQQQKSVEAVFYALKEKHTYGVKVKGRYDATHDLVIDPFPDRVWGTYFGGTSTELAYDAKVDASGNVIQVGSTSSTTNIASSGAFQGTFSGSTNGYIVKFNSSGQRLWSTYYGGTGSTSITGCALAANGDIFFSGSTTTSGLATSGAYQTANAGGGDILAGRFSADGSRIWATYLGGTGSDQALSCALDASNNLIITGSTGSSSGIATAGSFQPFKRNSFDAFLTSFSSTGAMNWSTYYGGANSDGATSLVVANNKIFMAGNTDSEDNISTVGSFMATYGGKTDGFWARFSTLGVREYATYVGGSEYDNINAIAADGSGAVAVTGATQSTSGISTTGVFQVNFVNGFDAYVSRYNSAGVRTWGTYYGGSNSDEASSIVIDGNGAIFASGLTNSWGLATSGAYQTSPAGSFDAFILKLNSNGTRAWSSYYGGSANESNNTLALGGAGTIYLSGYTSSLNNIVTNGAFQTVMAGISDAYLVRLSDCTPLPTPTISASGNTTICGSGTVTLTASGSGSGVTYNWSNGATGNSISVNQSGTYTAFASNSTCTSPISNAITISINPQPSVSSFSPTSGAVGTVVTINGSNFANVTSVTLNGISATFNIVSATQITATVPSGASSGPISVAISNCTASSSASFTVSSGQASSISTGTVSRNLCQGSVVSVPFTSNGGFNPGNTFTVQLSNASGGFGSPISIGTGTVSPIACTIPSGIASGTGYRVRVVSSNPSITGAANSNGTITINSQPVISSFTPTTAAVGSTVTVTGSGLEQVNSVLVGGLTTTPSFVSATSVQFVVPSGFTGGTITLSNGTCSATSSTSLTLQQQVANSIIVAPLLKTSFCAGESITITFDAQGTYNSNNTFRVILSSPNGGFSSPTILANGVTSSPVVVTLPSDVQPSSNYGIRVIALSPFTMGNDLTGLTITNAPVISSFTPTSASVGSQVVVTGNYLSTTQDLKVGGISTAFTVVSDNEIRFNVPAGFSGGFIQVSNGVDGCSSTSAQALSLSQTLSISTGVVSSSVCTGSVLSVPFTTTGSFAVGTVFTVQRSNASGGFGSPVNLGTGTTSPISVTIPAGLAAGTGYRFRVVSTSPSVIGSANSNGAVEVVSTPTISDFTPTSGPAGTVVTVNGSNFLATSQVYYNNTSVSFTRVSASQITFSIPTGASSGLIRVANGSCDAVSSSAFSVQTPPNGTLISCNLPKTTMCQGESFTLTFTQNGAFNEGNIFTAQLSDATGSFANPTAIGTATSGSSILATIPANLDATSGYRIRVVSSSPVSTSSEAIGVLTVKIAPTITAVSDNVIYENESFMVDGIGLSATSGVTINGMSSTFTIFSDTRIRVNTPNGVSSGALVVQTSSCPSTTPVSMIVPTIQQIRLVDAANHVVIQNISNNSSINTSASALNIEALTFPERIGSVTFELSGAVNRTVNDGWNVYTLCGDGGTLTNPNYNACNPALIPGSYSLTATPRKFGANDVRTGRPLTIQFRIVSTGSSRIAAEDYSLIIWDKENDVKVFPNPISKDCNVMVRLANDSENALITISDISGKRVATLHQGYLSSGEQMFSWHPANIANGFYLLKVEVGSHSITHKLMLSK